MKEQDRVLRPRKDGTPPRAPRTISDGTLRRELETLRAALHFAGRKRLIPRPVPEIPMPQAEKPRERWLTKEEARAYLAACTAPHAWLFAILMLTTAPRPGALLELQWSQVDLDAAIVDYGEGHGRKGRAVVPLKSTACAALRQAQIIARTRYVIEYREKPVKNMRNAVAAAGRRAGIDGVTPYVFRHTCATWLHHAGRPIDEIGRILAHSDPKTTWQVYAAKDAEFMRAALNTISLNLRGEGS